ncbi:restriction endonuclease subunit S [Rhodovulum sulfidophilum]|uniref:restriction endonuclease subunit S n=1 Tax=Rhodovulum sulfidophilum TaxID=35806 RepID=UPI0019249FBA|nr:restriction endonuclease subunit S [Rhodovulum sulfidophilum]MBL3559487.1 restriction endonuclease subunit S [Rhodovulum sulfidophilum]
MNIAAYPTYDSYQDSGVEWVGAIPASWNVRRGKWLFKKMDRPVRPIDDIVTCFRDGVVTLRANRRTEGFTNALKEHGYQGIRKGDLVIHAMDAFAGAVGVSDSDGKSTPVYSACVPRVEGTVNPHFYAYYMRHIALSGLLVAMAKGIRERSTDFRFNDFADLALAAPPIEEQTAIVAFLDGKCATIDEAVRIKEEQIRLLAERRQILIQQAVTRGLNPDAPMKDSGIDWIGQIPAHWEVKKVKHFGRNRSGDGITNSQLEDDGAYEVWGGNGLMGYSGHYNVDGDYIVIGRVGAYCGNIRLAQGKRWISDNALILRISGQVSSRYLAQALHAADLNRLNESNAQPLITGGKVSNLSFPYPPIDEQEAIVDHIVDGSDKIENAITIKESQITALREYKTSLINAAVTGKIKVL